MIELTERSLLSDPATLLAVVDAARRLGCSVALDDVGANEATVTMLEFVAPDIIKLDCTLVQSDPSPAQARVIAAVRAHAEFTGATILAEGVENEEHLARARALGATLGQGWLFGRPAALPSDTSRRRDVLERTPSVVSRRRSPASSAVPEVPSDLFGEIAPLVGRKAFVLSMARQIEDHARNAADPLVVLSAFQRARWFAPNVVDRYAVLAARHPFIAALGVGLPDEPAPGVHGAALDATERFSGEWTVTAVGRHYFAALIARDLGDVDVPDADRQFEFILTHDRRLVVSAARSLMRRVLPSHR
ncbi:EAL domain-containing protein [Rhodococcus sp. BP-349]|nr:EAL domain-containing protein [Rhodococcus sp. BP-363]MBY6545571.1 EAL domain-containing protein [Rhodococcus sp. BP-369]MBY6564801.1 EAL domain-containing protein [Rhodococcus sp. BP-370]MBY6578263.1 EAL domain-containing protein [Rhodococcus sp. BP-364]MBY6587564.1 EAL domain-containing protein [Rhodococcus sp. BP-358]MBY6591901.1 EAL domain-containing protein [Rhodococcus sp. BP-362]MBY6597068.1 EAL domain-containing protein [Rhodococcus sp. BP-359]MBY6601407.1 EAL domain-containing pr